MKGVTIQFICNGVKIDQRSLQNHVPRENDIIRLSADAFFTVTKVYWCYDEDHFEERVNLELKKKIKKGE